jgi:hypothetical protein
MVTELRAALRDAVSGEPQDELDPADLLRTGRRRVARRRLGIGVAVAAAAAVAGVAIAVPSLRDDEPAPVITPTPTPAPTTDVTPTGEPTHESETSMTPEEVVRADNAGLWFAGASADDPDFRVSAWTATCTWCPEQVPGLRPEFSAIATTTDGYATTTYARPPFPGGIYYVHSPAPGVLLLVDDANGGEWLVGRDGSVSERLPRIVEDRSFVEPRAWFSCLSTQVQPPDYLGTWCAFDVATETVYERRGSWSDSPGFTRSTVSPAAGLEPWGRQLLDASGGDLVAWWILQGERRTRTLASPPDGTDLVGDMVLDAREDLLYWSHVVGTDVLTFHVGDDRGESWRTIAQTVPTPGVSTEEILATPEGTVLLRHVEEEGSNLRARIWRLDSLEGGEWDLVHDTGDLPYTADVGEMRPLTIVGERLMLGSLYSDDDGQTWSQVDTWR